MVQLPQELIDAIMEKVNERDALHACCLAGRTFLAGSRSNLFRSMSLRWDPSSRTAPVFARVRSFFDEHPHLALYIRDLTVDIPKSQQDQVILKTVLLMLVNLERLAINGHAQHWDDLVPDLNSAILSLISLSSLQRLHLLRISSLPASVVLHAASTVRTLSLNRVIPQRLRDVSPNILPIIGLHNLILPWCLTTDTLTRVCDFLLAAQNLRRLTVDVHTSGYHRTLLVASSTNLQHIELDCGAFLIALDLPPLPALQSLTLILGKSIDADQRWSLPENLSSTITTLPMISPRLEALNLTIHIRTLGTEPLWNDPNPFPFFESPSYREQLPRLQNIHCSLGYSDPFVACAGAYFELAFQRFVAFLESKLPAAFDEGILTFARGVQRSRLNYFDNLP
ncbi:hypothetical protein MVEN_00276900 [Mycena venus]|uniref:Uncharacterized protein n=1 Tax=Mycena venus TaxID=2733690 RepID=A0A8H6Z2I3_9AGAR|nr:hypothetical protein MVEN_00276900 [Mycena venus]